MATEGEQHHFVLMYVINNFSVCLLSSNNLKRIYILLTSSARFENTAKLLEVTVINVTYNEYFS